MITYENSAFGIWILTRVHGSALYKSIFPALISTIIYVSIVLWVDGTKRVESFLHPYPMQALVTAFTFLLVFRANYSYNRWWEAYSAVYLMHSKWLDLATEVAAFHYQSKRYDGCKPPSFGANPHVQSLDLLASRRTISGENIQAKNWASGNLSLDGSLSGFGTSNKNLEEETGRMQRGLSRHTSKTTMTDLMEQMDAAEKKSNMNLNDLMPLESEDFEINGNKRGKNENSSESDGSFHSQRGKKANGSDRQSWLSKLKEKSFKSKKNNLDPQEDVLPIHLGDSAEADASDSKRRSWVQKIKLNNRARAQPEQKSKRRRPRRSIDKFQTATARLFNTRKSITRRPAAFLEQGDKLEPRDIYDEKTGVKYSKFTGASRKHLREGNIDPDAHPPLLFLEECAHLLSLMSAVAFSTLRNDLPEAESPLTVFVPGLPWPLVDPDGYKGAIRKGWTQSRSRLYSVLQFALGRSRNDHARTLYNAARPFRVIGNVSDAEIEQLQEARGPLAKVSLVSMWLLEMMSREYQAGSTGAVAPPIISRLFGFVSEGLTGYNQARKIAYIPFPFPHAQITTLFMYIVDFIVTPLLMTTFVTNIWLGLVLNLFSVLCFTGLHEVAREIENPFQNVPNDVPLNNYQAQFNEGLMVMFYGYHPDAFWTRQHSSTIQSAGSRRSAQYNNRSPQHSAIRKDNYDSNCARGQGQHDFNSTAVGTNSGFKNDSTGALIAKYHRRAANKVSFGSNRNNNPAANQPALQPMNILSHDPMGKTVQEEASSIFTANNGEGIVPGSDTNTSSGGGQIGNVQTKNLFRVPSGDSQSNSRSLHDPTQVIPRDHIGQASSITGSDRSGSEHSGNLFCIPSGRILDASFSEGSFEVLHTGSGSFRLLPEDQIEENSTGVQFRVPSKGSD